MTRSILSEPDRRAAHAAAEALRAAFPFVSRVVVFGSRARGEAEPDSDMDLLVLTRGSISHEQRSAVTRLLSPLGRALGVMFSTIVVDEESWTSGVYRVLPIRREVERDGIAA